MSTITSIEQLEAVPVGQAIQVEGNTNPFVRNAVGFQQGTATLAPSQFLTWVTGGQVTTTDQTAPVTTVGQFTIGQTLTTRQVRDLPIGARVSVNPDREGATFYEKVDTDNNTRHGWRRGTGQTLDTTTTYTHTHDTFAQQHGWRVMYLPTPPFTVGQTLTMTDLAALPVGARISAGHYGPFVKRDEDREWQGETYSGAWRQSAEFTDPSEPITLVAMPEQPVVQPGVGDRITLDQMRALPIGATVEHTMSGDMEKDGDDHWKGVHVSSVTDITENLWATRTAVRSLPAATTLAEPVMATASSVAPVVTGLDPQRVQDMLNEYLAEQSGLSYSEREGIEQVLVNLGLEAISPKETVTVEVAVNGETTVSFDDSEINDQIGASGISLDVDESSYDLEVAWTATVEVEVEVNRGDCACGDVTEDQVVSAVENAGHQGNFTVTDYSGSCPNC